MCFFFLMNHIARRRNYLLETETTASSFSSSGGCRIFDEQTTTSSPVVVLVMDDDQYQHQHEDNDYSGHCNSSTGGGEYNMHTVKDNNSNSNNNNTRPARRPSWFVIQVTIVASLGGKFLFSKLSTKSFFSLQAYALVVMLFLFICDGHCLLEYGSGILFGYDLGVISGALPQLIATFDLTSKQQEIVVSILYVGGGLGAAVGGLLCDAFGRKWAILVTDVVFLLGAIILMCAPTLNWVLFGRIVVGFAVAVSGIADVSYLHEIAPVQWRGAIVSVNEACIALGFLLAFVMGCLLSYEGNDNSGWRIMFGASGIVAVIQFLGMWNLPESPVWLKECGRYEESLLALQRIHSMTSTSASLIQQPQLEMGGTSLMENTTVAHHDTAGDTISNNIQVVVPGEVSSSSSSSQAPPLPPPPRSSKRRVVVYDALTTNDEVVTNTQAPLSAAEATAGATSAAASITSLGVSSSSSSNSLTPFCASNVASIPATTGGTAQRRRRPLSSPSSSFFMGGLYIVWARLVQASRHVVYVLVQIKRFIVSTMETYRPQAYIALFLSITQQLCGQNNVLSYAPLIFASILVKNNNNDEKSDNDDDAQALSLASMQAWATLSIGVVKFVVTVLVIWKIESLGRRFLLLTGMCTIALGLLLLTIAFGGAHVAQSQQQQQGGDDSGSSAQADGEQVVVVDDHLGGFYLAVPGVLLVVCGYSMSFGPLTWLLTSELFPTDIRGRALGASTIVTYSTAAIVTSTFLSSQEWLGGTSAVFSMYLVVTVIGFLFAFMAIPDTKEKSVQEIQDDLNAMMWWRIMTTASSSSAEAEAGSGAQYHDAHTGDGPMSRRDERDVILT